MKLCTLQTYTDVYVYTIRKTFARRPNAYKTVKRSTILVAITVEKVNIILSGNFFNWPPRNCSYSQMLVYLYLLIFNSEKTRD